MSMGTRKRGPPFLLEKPLAARLRFEREQAGCKPPTFSSEEQARIIGDHSGCIRSSSSSWSSSTAPFPFLVKTASATFPIPAEKRRKLEGARDGEVFARGAGDMECDAPETPRENCAEEVLPEAAQEQWGSGSWLGVERGDEPGGDRPLSPEKEGGITSSGELAQKTTTLG